MWKHRFYCIEYTQVRGHIPVWETHACTVWGIMCPVACHSLHAGKGTGRNTLSEASERKKVRFAKSVDHGKAHLQFIETLDPRSKMEVLYIHREWRCPILQEDDTVSSVPYSDLPTK